MRSLLPLAICFGCLLVMIYPAFAAQTASPNRSQIQICPKDKHGKCIRPAQTQQYELGLPKINKDGRTKRQIKGK